MAFKSPMLAKDYDENKITYPRLGSVKLDGWRGVINEARIKTRSGKEVRNRFTPARFGRVGLEGLDGEFIVGAWNDQETFNRTESGMKKFEGEPDVVFHVFDCYDLPDMPYLGRLREAERRVQAWRESVPEDQRGLVRVLEQVVITSAEELADFEAAALDDGFEGVMLREPNSPYKYGRSSTTPGNDHLLKVKRFTDDEGVIIGYEELMHNSNESQTNELGRTFRTSHKENLVPSGMIGSYICTNNDKWPGQKFNVSCGSMTHPEKKERFRMFNFDLGKTIRFKHLSHGAKDKPRHGVFGGFRAEEDATALA